MRNVRTHNKMTKAFPGDKGRSAQTGPKHKSRILGQSGFNTNPVKLIITVIGDISPPTTDGKLTTNNKLEAVL